MKRFFAMALALLLLTACASTPAQVEDEDGNASLPAQQTGGEVSEVPRKEETEEPILEFTLSDTFQSLLDKVNAEHKSVTLFEGDYSDYLVRYEDPELDVSLYEVDYDAMPNVNTTLTLEQVTADMESYYKLLRSEYGAYTYFGGDEVFRPAIDAVIADCAAMETITVAAWIQSMVDHMRFINDGHFGIAGLTMGKYAVPFFFRNVVFHKTDEGYVAEDGRLVASVDGFEDLDELFKLSLTVDGELVYYPVVLESFYYQRLMYGTVTCSTTVLTVHFTDGTTVGLFSEPYSLGNYEREYVVDTCVKNGVPFVILNEFERINGGREFNDTAFRYRDSDILIVDLQTNSGGDSSMAIEWYTDYTLQEVWGHWLGIYGGTPDMMYEKHLSRTDKEFATSENVLILLTSKLTASCGDAFVDLAHNVENTLIVGENTNGILASSLGEWTLPNTGLYVKFGASLILHPEGEHFEEFRGYYPDIWVPAAEAEEAVMNFIAKNTTVK